MRTIDQLVAALNGAGVRFRLEDGTLRYLGPPDLPAALRAEMVARKDEIRALLAGVPAEAEPAIRPVPRTGPLPLSFAQQRLWFLDQWQPGNPIYNEPAAVRIEGALDEAALFRALREIVRRHEIFRTVYEAVDGAPRQVVRDDRRLELPVVDLRGQGEEALDTALVAEARRPFDLSRDIMLRAVLFRTGDDEHLLSLVMHHIACDGWSAGVLVRELVALYTAFREKRSSPLPPLPIQYADFASWQRAPEQASRLARDLDFWRDHLSGAPTRTDLPTDFPRPAHETFNGARHDFRIDPETTAQAGALARRHGASLFMVLRAAFDVLMYRYSGQSDIVVGTAIANRDRAELEPLAGFFVNTLALRSDLSGEPSFAVLVERVKAAAQAAYAHQSLPFERLVEVLSPQRDLSHAPLFQVMFTLQNAPETVLELPGLRIAAVDVPRDTAKFDLILFMRERDGGLAGTWEYNTDLFLPATIARMARHFANLLKAALASPDTAIGRLAMLDDAERRHLVEGWNGTAMNYPRDASIPALFARRAAATPDAPAVDGPDGRLDYRDLDRASNRLAHRLLAAGVSVGDPVGLALDRSAAFVAGALGILKAGAAYLPLDPTYPRERRDFMVADAGLRLLVTDAAGATAFASFAGTVVRLDDPDGSLAAQPAHDPGLAVDAMSPAYVMYTSGSTGRPKGVVVPHRAVVRLVSDTDYVDFPAMRRIAHASNVAFDAATFEIWGALLHGAEIVVIAKDTLLSPAALARDLREKRVDAMFLTPAVFRQVAAARPDAFAGLSHLLVGGDAMPVDAARRVLLSGAAPRALANVYGPTETVTFACWHPVASVPQGAVAVPIGRPIANTTLHVLDAAMQPVPVGVYGELHIGGDAVALRYLNRPELTAERFVGNPFGEGRLYRTGDRVRRLPDGNIVFGGRYDQQIKLRGYRVEPGEIETVLRSHPRVRDAIVLPRDAAAGDPRLVAYVVAAEADAAARADQVAQWQALFDTTYRGEVATRTAAPVEQGDPARNFTGWESSYTGEPIPLTEMEEWLERTLDEIEALRPRRILEIGCGTGLLLARLAPGRDTYHATDFSQGALDGIEALRRLRPDLDHVVLARASADEAPPAVAGGYDLIVLNSVVQYFPSIAYLGRVLALAAERLVPGGRIYVGDVRNLDLQEAFHASVEGRRAAGRGTIGELRRRIREAVTDEEELLVAPDFFRDIARFVPGLSCERVSLKRGIHRNELTRFRYQAVLRRADASRSADEVLPEWLSWRDIPEGLHGVARLLDHARPAVLAIAAIPNARLGYENALLAALGAASDPDAIVALDEGDDTGADPEALHGLAHRFGYGVAVTFSDIAEAGAFDAVFQRETPAAVAWSGRPRGRAGTLPDIDTYANDPLLGRQSRQLTPELRAFMQERLPDYMLPAAYVFLARWPISPNGKVDRKALPDPNWQRSAASRFVAPAPGIERRIAEIWQAVLGLDRIGATENFFEIGGHSLLATQIVSRLRAAFGLEVGLRAFFENPTIAEQSRYLDRAGVGAASAPQDPVRDTMQEEFVI